MLWLGTAEIDAAQADAAADQPAGDAVHDDPEGAVGEGGAGGAGVIQLDLGQAVGDDQFAAGVVEHDTEKP